MHNGPDAPVVRQRWMFTDQPFFPLGTNCVLMNRVWDGDTSTEFHVGMLPPATANYRQDARWTLPPDFHPNHICNPEWLSTGEPWPNDLPPTVYDDFWIPVCCGAVNHLIAGGVEVGGPVVHYYGPRRSILGGYVLGGPVVHTASYAREVLGGYVLGGPVVHSFVVPREVLGGVVVGGPVVHSFVVPREVLGGVVVGGAVVHSYAPAREVLGGVVVGGAVVRTIVYTDGTGDGFEIGGSAGDDFTPGDVLPGNSCADAGLAAFETLYTYSATSGVEYWWKIPVTAGVTYYFSTPDFAMTTMCLIYVGGSCPSPTPQDFTVPVLNCRQFVAQATGYFYCRWSLFFGTATIKWRLSTVGCL